MEDKTSVLPDEVLLHILLHLPVAGIANLSLTNSRWHSVCSDPQLWKQLHQQYGSKCIQGHDWYQSYKTVTATIKEYKRSDVGWNFYETRLFFYAIAQGLDTLVEQLAEDHPEVLNAVYDRHVPVIAAVHHNQLHILQLLVERFHLTIGLYNFEQALLVACEKRISLELMDYLLDQQPIELQPGLCRPLFIAVQRGHVEIVQRLLERYEVKVEEKHLEAAIKGEHTDLALQLGKICIGAESVEDLMRWIVITKEDALMLGCALAKGWRVADWAALLGDYKASAKKNRCIPRKEVIDMLVALDEEQKSSTRMTIKGWIQKLLRPQALIPTCTVLLLMVLFV